MIPYDRYTELLSKLINRTFTEPEKEDIGKYSALLSPAIPPPTDATSGVSA